jgi:hypothetical protein
MALQRSGTTVYRELPPTTFVACTIFFIADGGGKPAGRCLDAISLVCHSDRDGRHPRQAHPMNVQQMRRLVHDAAEPELDMNDSNSTIRRLTMNIIACQLNRIATYASNDEPFKLYHQALGNGDLRISDAPHHDYSDFGKWLDIGEPSNLPLPPWSHRGVYIRVNLLDMLFIRFGTAHRLDTAATGIWVFSSGREPGFLNSAVETLLRHELLNGSEPHSAIAAAVSKFNLPDGSITSLTPHLLWNTVRL